MDKIKNTINTMFQKLFTIDQHPFFADLLRVEKISKDFMGNVKKHITYKTKFEENITIPPDLKIHDIVYKTLNTDTIKKLSDEMNKVSNWSKILKIVSYMSQYILESNVKDEEKLYQLIKGNKTLNIMIIGCGPAGLFLASYLHLYYNMTMDKTRKINIVLFDSRIDKIGFRKPYNRQRLFATSSAYLNLIIPKLYCWNEPEKYNNAIFINIFALEYILYTTAINHNIPIIYGDYKWDDYKTIITKGDFQVVFDCTGGRLKHDLMKNIDTKWLDNFKHNIKLNKKIIVNPELNLVELDDYKKTSKFRKHYYYGSLSVYIHETGQDRFINKYDIDIKNNYDLLYLKNIKSKRFNYDNIVILIKGIKDSITRNYLYSTLFNKKTSYNNMIFSFDIFRIYIRHAIKIADVFTINKQKVLYIGAGDTIFHSHFIIGAGLNRTLDFSVKCANMLNDLI